MQGKLADMYTAMNAARAYVYAVARACDRGETSRKDAAGAILFAAEKATWMALEAIQALGGNGYVNEFATGRLLRDAKLYEIGAGTSEIRRMLIGRELFDETSSGLFCLSLRRGRSLRSIACLCARLRATLRAVRRGARSRAPARFAFRLLFSNASRRRARNIPIDVCSHN